MEERPVDLERLRETHALATALLESLMQLDLGEASALLRPRDEDWPAVFLPEFAEQAKQGYAEFWEHDQRPEAKPGQIAVTISGVIPAWMFGSDNRASSQHPGGYRDVASALQPDVHWVSWKFHEPGRTVGMAHNGLVRVTDDRFVWLPKPWRALRA